MSAVYEQHRDEVRTTHTPPSTTHTPPHLSQVSHLSTIISLSHTHAMPRNGAVPSRLLALQQDGFMYMMYSGENTFGSLGLGMEEVMEAAVAEGLVEVASA